jgi:probable rRNA maturation factor
MITIEINKPFTALLSEKWIEQYATQIIRLSGYSQPVDLSILITSDSALKDLNHEFLDIDKPTDVLSFGSDMVNPENGVLIIGDIAISYKSAERQALEAGHPIENEILLLLTHAVLHLKGYDHSTKNEKQLMWQKQQEILEALNIKINRISGDEDFHD